VFGLVLAPCVAIASPVTPYTIQHLVAQGNPEQAIVLLQPILRSDPHSAKAWFLDAEALDAEGKLPQAKIALHTSEQLSPDMKFTNKSDLKQLERRVGLTNVKLKRENAQSSHILFMLLLFMLMVGIISFGGYRFFRRKNELRAENSRKDLMVTITDTVNSDLHRQMLDASSNNDTVVINRINNAIATINQILEQLRKSQKCSLSEKQTNVSRCESSFRSVLSDLQKTGRFDTVVAEKIDPLRPRAPSPIRTSTATSTITSPSSGCHSSSYGEHSSNPRPSVFSNNYRSPMQSSSSSAIDGIVEGVELGVGIAIGEDIVADIFDDSQDSNNGGMFGSGDSFGGSDNGWTGSNDSFGGSDDGLTGSDNSFGGSDDGLTGSDDSFGGSDDGMSDSDSW
jgi:hypothetical protein